MLCKRLEARELGDEPPAVFQRASLVEEHHVDHLGLYLTLKGHTGCVNTLKWNQPGTILLSGSDDRTVRVWGLDGQTKRVIETGHTQNIFAVDFIPCGGDRKVISAAGDHSIRLRDVEAKEMEETVWMTNGRVKRLATTPAEPHLCWSASEDGRIRQIDVRKEAAEELIKAPKPASECKSVAVSPVDPYQLVVALNTAAVPIYDRRNVKEPLVTLIPGHVLLTNYKSRRFSGLPGSVTHVAFSQTGEEVIVNLGADQIYVYSLAEDHSPSVVDDLRRVLTRPKDGLPRPFKVTDSCSSQREHAKKLFESRKNSAAIDIYSECLASKNLLQDDRSMLLANRAAALLARQWTGDAYACTRDSIEASLLSDNSNPKALFRLARSLVCLNQTSLAGDICNLIDEFFPEGSVTNRIRDAIAKSEGEQREWNTSPKKRDYSQRFCGHTNTKTDIKEANFFGGHDEWIVAGSDCGSLLLWERRSGVLKAVFKADEHILNIAQPHPLLPLIATSGIEDVIRFWQPSEKADEEERRYEEPWPEMDKRHDEEEDYVLMMGDRLLGRRIEIPQCAQS